MLELPANMRAGTSVRLSQPENAAYASLSRGRSANMPSGMDSREVFW